MFFKKKNNLIYAFIFLVIILIGIGLRFIHFPNFPPSLNWDEVSHGYNAYSILQSGVDEWGQKYPIINFRAYGDYPLPLNLYLTIPFIKFLGLNEFSIRLPHTILGVLTIISVYFLVWGITRRKNISLLSSLLVAVGPWYVFPAHFVAQSNLSLFLLISAFAAFFNRNSGRYSLPLSFILLGLTLYSYNTTRIFSPIILVVLLFLYKKELWNYFKKDKFVAILSTLIIVGFFAPLPYILFKPEARARSQWVFLVDSGAVAKIEQQRVNSKFNPLITKIIYNRPIYFLKEFSKNYFGYFSPNFLFFKGGTQYQFSLPNHGLLYPINLPFFYLGIVYLVYKVIKDKNTNFKFILFWLILSPIPASITQEKFAVLRATTMLPLPEILSAFGFYCVIDQFKNKGWSTFFLTATYSIFMFFGIENYLINLIQNYSAKYSWAWQYGYKEVVEYAKDNYSKYDKIIITKKYGEPHEYLLFFWPWDPQNYRNDSNLIRYYQTGWFWVDRFDKFYFVNDWQVAEDMKLESGGKISCLNSKCLLISSPNNYPAGWKNLKTINFLNGQPAFEIYEN